MKQVTVYEFMLEIAKDFSIDINKEFTIRLPKDKKAIKSFTSSLADMVRIFDGEKEHRYMINACKRNDEALQKGIELRYSGTKSLSEVIKESGVELKVKKCKVCEGGGWYSEGFQYFHKEVYCEI